MIEVVWRGIKLLDEASPFESLWDGDKLRGESSFIEDAENPDETTTSSSCSTSSWSDDRSTRSPLHLQEASDSTVGSDRSSVLLRNSFSQRLSRTSTIPLYDNEVKECILERASSFYMRYGKPMHHDEQELYHEVNNTAKRKIRKANPMKRRLSDAPQLEQYYADRDLSSINTVIVGSRLRISFSSRSLKIATVAGLVFFSLVGLFITCVSSRRSGFPNLNDDLGGVMDGIIQLSGPEMTKNPSLQRPTLSGDEITSNLPSLDQPLTNKSEHENEIGSLSNKAFGDWGVVEFSGPSIDESFRSVLEPLERPSDVPLFLHMPRSGGKILNNILRQCHNFVTTSRTGETNDNNNILNVVPHPDGGQQINVNTFTATGLKRARELSLVRSGAVDVIFTNQFQESAQLFDRDHRGRVFTLIRNPVHQAASVFYFLQNATRDDPDYNRALRFMTLEEYAATSPRAGANPLTRLLTNDEEGRLTDRHVALAKEILKQKVLIGIEERFDESILRFQKYFGWHSQDQKSCTDNQKLEASLRRNRHPVMEGESAAYRLLAKRNWADMELYRFAVRLFEEQGILIKQVHHR